MIDIAEELKQQTEGLGPVETLAYLADAFQGKIIFSTSFGWEDQVVTHMIFDNNLPIKVLLPSSTLPAVINFNISIYRLEFGFIV